MTDRPIIFNSSMVRALLAGTKTQTRRIFTPPKPFAPDDDIAVQIATGTIKPRINVGDRLWVRENFALVPRGMGEAPPRAVFMADFANVGGMRFKPSIHMPRRCSRLTLAVTDVRVQRLNDISEADAKAEGSPLVSGSYLHATWFRELWDGLHGAGSWDANPWVVAITFDLRRHNIDKEAP